MAVAAGLLLVQSAESAHAACGDYLFHRSMADHQPVDAATGHNDQAPQPVAPCHGPGCRNIPTDAPAPPAPVTYSDFRDFAVFAGSADRSATRRRVRWSQADSDVAVIGYFSSVFRPPEASAL
jgi:hypothetical protein